MPAAPEVDDRGGFVGGIEIERQPDAEHPGQANGHVRIAGKVEVELEGVGQGAAPGLEKGQGRSGLRGVEHGRRIDRHAIGQHHLFEEPQGEDGQAHRQVFRLEAVNGRPGELGKHLMVVDDGAGNQLREEGHEEGVMQEAVFVGLATIGVDQVGDLLEGEEGDRQRQDDGLQYQVVAEQGVEVVNEEVGVLVVAQQAKIGGNAGDQNGLGSAWGGEDLPARALRATPTA